MRITLAVLAAAAGLAVAACGGGGAGTTGSGTTTTEAAPTSAAFPGQALASGCVWQDFEATVRSGPNAGTELRGALVAAVDGDLVHGHLFPADDPGSAVPVSGSHTATTLTLAFTTAAGTLEGTGAIDGQLCTDGLEGPLAGPAEGDAGDWIGLGLDDYTVRVDGDGYGIGGLSAGATDAKTEQLSPSCSKETFGDGHSSITCYNGGVKCTTYYPAGGGAAQTLCGKYPPDARGVEDFEE